MVELVEYHALHFHKLNLILTNYVLLVHYLQRIYFARVLPLRFCHLLIASFHMLWLKLIIP